LPTSALSLFATPCWGLRMTIWTQASQIVATIIFVITIYMV